MAFGSTSGVSAWLMASNVLLLSLPPRWTVRGRGGIGDDLSLSKLETQTPGKRDEQQKKQKKRSSIDLPSRYVIEILTSRDRSGGAQPSCL